MEAPPNPPAAAFSPFPGLDPTKPAAEQSWDLFTQALRVILAQWTTLSLAVSNEWGGGNSKQKADEIANCLLSEFNDVRIGKAKEVEASEIEEFLYQQLEQDFHMQVEDSSVEQVAKLLLTHFAYCVKGNFAPVLQLIASYKPPNVKSSMKGPKPAPGAVTPSSTASPTAAPAQPTSHPAPAPAAPGGDATMAEDNEWTPVVTSRKGKKGEKK